MSHKVYGLPLIEEALIARFDYLASTGAGWEEFIEVHHTFIQLKQAQALERIAKKLEDGQLSILEGENIATAVKLIADRMPD